MSYLEFLKLIFDGDEDARRASSSPSNIFFVLMEAAKAASINTKKRGGARCVKAPAGRLDTAGSTRKELFSKNPA